jgi:uncharacterized protein (DUF1778 family)
MNNPLKDLKQTKLILNEEQWEKFIFTINNPPEPSKKLKELMREYGSFALKGYNESNS